MSINIPIVLVNNDRRNQKTDYLQKRLLNWELIMSNPCRDWARKFCTKLKIIAFNNSNETMYTCWMWYQLCEPLSVSQRNVKSESPIEHSHLRNVLSESCLRPQICYHKSSLIRKQPDCLQLDWLLSNCMDIHQFIALPHKSSFLSMSERWSCV